MEKKRLISDFNKFLENFDKIFISPSILNDSISSKKFLEVFLKSNIKEYSVLLTQEMYSEYSTSSVLKTLLAHNLLQMRGEVDNRKLLLLNSTYQIATKELSKRKHYKFLLLTNDKEEGIKYKRMVSQDQYANGSNSCGCNDMGRVFEYLYEAPKEKVEFTFKVDNEIDEFSVVFLQGNDKVGFRTLYDEKDTKAKCVKCESVYKYTIDKGILQNGVTKIKFVAKKGHKRMVSNVSYDLYLEKKQEWQIAIQGNTLFGRFLNGDRCDITPEAKAKPDSDSIDTDVVCQYYGGRKVSLPEDAKINSKNIKEHDVVFTKKKKKIQIKKRVGSGGEGVVFETNIPNVVCKILNNKTGENLTENKRNKIEYMVKHKVNNSLVMWPIDTVYNTQGKFVGFTMESIKGLELSKLVSEMPKAKSKNFNTFGVLDITRTELVGMIVSILKTIVYLHDRNIILGDIKLENFMIKNKDVSKVFFVDCDSYQISDFPATKVSPGYIPPELVGVKVDTVYRTFGNENYATFALIFMLLMKGFKPYAQRHIEMSEENRAKQGIFPYFLDSKKTQKHCPAGYPTPNWSHLPGYVKKSFINNASKQGDNFGEKQRYGAEEWLDIFESYQSDLKNGKLKKLDRKYNVGIQDFKDSPINYAKVDIDILRVISKSIKTLILKDGVVKLFEMTHQNVNDKMVELVTEHLKKETTYEDKSRGYKFVLRKNIGVMYDIELSFISSC